MPEQRGGLAQRHMLRMLLQAALLVVVYGTVVITGARSNVQGAIEMAAYGTIILFPLAVIVQMLVVIWLERRGH